MIYKLYLDRRWDIQSITSVRRVYFVRNFILLEIDLNYQSYKLQ